MKLPISVQDLYSQEFTSLDYIFCSLLWFTLIKFNTATVIKWKITILSNAIICRAHIWIINQNLSFFSDKLWTTNIVKLYNTFLELPSQISWVRCSCTSPDVYVIIVTKTLITSLHHKLQLAYSYLTNIDKNFSIFISRNPRQKL